MKEYLKMDDVFDLPIKESEIMWMVAHDSPDRLECAVHAINSHDELVAEVERLRAIISRIKSPTSDDCMEFLCAAFRHCDYEIKGDFEIDDMRPAFVLYANSKGA